MFSGNGRAFYCLLLVLVLCLAPCQGVYARKDKVYHLCGRQLRQLLYICGEQKRSYVPLSANYKGKTWLQSHNNNTLSIIRRICIRQISKCSKPTHPKKLVAFFLPDELYYHNGMVAYNSDVSVSNIHRRARRFLYSCCKNGCTAS